MNKLTQAKRVQVIAALVEGNSVRATCRMTGRLQESGPETLGGSRHGLCAILG